MAGIGAKSHAIGVFPRLDADDAQHDKTYDKHNPDTQPASGNMISEIEEPLEPDHSHLLTRQAAVKQLDNSRSRRTDQLSAGS